MEKQDLKREMFRQVSLAFEGVNEQNFSNGQIREIIKDTAYILDLKVKSFVFQKEATTPVHPVLRNLLLFMAGYADIETIKATMGKIIDVCVEGYSERPPTRLARINTLAGELYNQCEDAYKSSSTSSQFEVDLLDPLDEEVSCLSRKSRIFNRIVNEINEAKRLSGNVPSISIFHLKEVQRFRDELEQYIGGESLQPDIDQVFPTSKRLEVYRIILDALDSLNEKDKNTLSELMNKDPALPSQKFPELHPKGPSAP